MRWAVIGVVAVGCRHVPSTPLASDASPADSPVADSAIIDAPIDAVPPDSFVPDESAPLGMNDISFLVPLPADPSTPALAAMTGFATNPDLIPRELHTRITAGGDVTNPYEQFHIVAMRFDLCDRTAIGPCQAGVDGQWRMTFQPLRPTAPTQAADVALHAAYRIPSQDVAYVVNELRALARIRQLDITRPLAVNEMLTAATPTEYTTRLRALVAMLARADRLIRLTVFAQDAHLAPFQWHFSGLEPVNGTFQYFDIPGINISWIVQDAGASTPVPAFTASPIADRPPGSTFALSKTSFTAETAAERAQSLEALNIILNPTLTTPKTVHCANCHFATRSAVSCSAIAGVDLATVPSHFASPHDLSIANGILATDDFSGRIFGWRDQFPEISLRVANETAMVLEEIEQRFPPVQP
jgi:hypothetical protein